MWALTEGAVRIARHPVAKCLAACLLAAATRALRSSAANSGNACA